MNLKLLIAVVAATAALSTANADSAERPRGYLDPAEFDVTHVIEPAPRPGDPRYETDRKVFRATRKLAGSPRWKLATQDADYSVSALANDFSCAVGVKLTPENAPKLMTVIQRAGSDTSAQSGKAKAVYQRNRPFTIDKGQICQPASELYDEKAHRMSYDYPSGHTTWGWTWALVLSSIAPDRAQQILERGRAYGDSRFVCGAHNESAVEAGMLSATATMAIVQTKPDYLADRLAAKAELDALRASGERPVGCDAEAALIRERVMPRL
ncbi:phosphatase PAP2 family protein (plasmid) [Novosphingobium sp. BL-8A]|uniref:acid phosphatase n=1 Tax=Novosphingobium sp. BL-8A TaxID=3127639 RepID=UPI0037582D3A